jgi:hypothetical protein
LFSAVNIVSEKEIIVRGRVASTGEYLEKILKLAVNVADNFDGRLKFKEHGLGQENIT